MGKDFSSQTEGYIEVGDIPEFKLYQHQTGEFLSLNGNISPWDNLSVHKIEILHTNTNIFSELYQINSTYPNPFNSKTRLSFTIPVKSNVIIDIYGITGRKIENILDNNYELGSHEIIFNAVDLPSGIYFAKFTIFDSNNSSSNSVIEKSQKLILLK